PTTVSVPQSHGLPPRARASATIPLVAAINKMISNMGASVLNDDRFLVFAEDAAEGIGNFADGGVGFDGGEDGREEVFGSGGDALELGKGGLDAGGIAPGAESVEAGDLGALDFGVDAENGNGAVFVFTA